MSLYGSHKEALKKAAVSYLKSSGGRAPHENFWNDVGKHGGLTISCKKYGVSKMNALFREFSDVLYIDDKKFVSLLKDRQTQHQHQQARLEVDCDSDADSETSTSEVPPLQFLFRENVVNILRTLGGQCRLSTFWDLYHSEHSASIPRNVTGDQLLKSCKDIINIQDDVLILKQTPSMLQPESMKSSSTSQPWGTGAESSFAARSSRTSESSLDSDPDKLLRDTPPPARQSDFIPFSDGSSGGGSHSHGQPSFQRYGNNQPVVHQFLSPRVPATPPRHIFNTSALQQVTPQSLMAQNFMSQFRNNSPQPRMVAFASPNLIAPQHPIESPLFEPLPSEWPKPPVRSGPPPGTKIIEEKKEITVQPLNLPVGHRLTTEEVDLQVEDSIEILSSASEHVSLERVEGMVLQKYQVPNFRTLNLRKHFDQLSKVIEHSRLLGKVNAYIQNFARSRSICTLYELGECCREYHPEKKSFEYLRLGPLQKMPVVYQLFCFPVDEYIPEITSVDILEHLNCFLDKTNKWRDRVELDEFLGFLKDEYHVDTPFSLGVRIRSLPLAIQTLKKSKRDAAVTRKSVIERMDIVLQSDVADAFKKFRANILQKSREGNEELRLHYMNLMPDVAMREIFSKFELLSKVMAETPTEIRKLEKFQRSFEAFIKVACQEKIPRMLFQLAICMSNHDIMESAQEFEEQQVRKQKQEATQEEGSSKEHKQKKQPPTKVNLRDKVLFYMNKCLEHGTLSLSHLERIEARVLGDFGFENYTDMGYGRFLEFVGLETKIKSLLEECGGTMLGSSSSSHEVESAYKPSQLEVLEFILQSRYAGTSQISETESALCEQYHVTDVRHLGHGNISRLSSSADKSGRHGAKDYHCVFEAALLGKSCPTTRRSQVGIQGRKSREEAMACLTACPLLEDLAEWSLWPLVFQPQHGPLRQFVERHGGRKEVPLAGGTKMATSNFIALEAEPGKLLKLSAHSTPEIFVKALDSGRADVTAGHLVSMIVCYQGLENTPVALLANHVKTKLFALHAQSSFVGTPGGPPSRDVNMRVDLAVQFVTDVLLCLPLRIAIAIANQILLEPLSSVVGSAKSKNLIVQACSLPWQQQRLELLGCLLGLPEWEVSMGKRLQFPAESVTNIVSDELLGAADAVVEDEIIFSSNSEVSESDIDDILSEEEDKTVEAEKVKDNTEHESEEGKPGISDDVDEEETGDEDDEEDSDESSEDKEEATDDESEDEVQGEEGSSDSLETESDENCEMESREKRCKAVVDSIRAEEFGVGIHLDDTGKKLLQRQQERQGRSLDRLSKDLYSKDTHFVLELIQNADDNPYDSDIQPAIKFTIDESGVTVMNNELGFEERNIRALCDVGKSTKEKHKYGYIGQKGIGFKSVFRVTSRPEVHSHGFHICFDLSSGPVGYILPHWIEDRKDEEGWQTRIILPWTEEIKNQIYRHAARFNDIQPSLLLFLHRLRQITIDNKVEGNSLTMVRKDFPNREVQISHSGGTDKWLVLRKTLDASAVSIQAKSGVEVESTEIALAFPLRGKTVALNSQVRSEKLPVFAFLPLRSYGFRFIVQGDFDVPSSREDVNKDSSWNQWLRNEIHTLFIEALDAFKARPELNAVESLLMFLQFVPMEGEVLDFFRPVTSQILAQLRAKECMPVLNTDKKGDILWKMPSKTVITHDALVREVVPPELLQQYLGLHYLHPDVTAVLDESMSQALQVETLTTEHLLHIGRSIASSWHEGAEGARVTEIAKWLACVYRSLDDFQDNSSHMETLSKFKIIPVTSGKLVSLTDTVVFMLTEDTNKLGNKGRNNPKQRVRDPLQELKKDLDLVHFDLTNTLDDEINSQVVKLLCMMGVKQLASHDLIHSHIMPVLKSEAWKNKDRQVLISYLIYIKAEYDKNPSIINIEDLSNVVRLATNRGVLLLAENDIHFPTAYKNEVDLQNVFPCMEWILIDSAYLPSMPTQSEIQSWHSFLSMLGVTDFLKVRRTEMQFNKEKINETAWAPFKDIWPDSPDGYIICDFHCEEFHKLVTSNQPKEKMLRQMRKLFALLDCLWDKQYKKFVNTQLKSASGHILRDVIETSFAIHLKSLAWVPTVSKSVDMDTEEKCSVSESQDLKIPAELYSKNREIEKLLEHTVSYLAVDPQRNSSFASFLQIQMRVDVQSVKKALLSWSERDPSSPKTPKVFCTSLRHMFELYSYLGDNLSNKEAQDLLHQHATIFLPVSAVVNPEEIVAGKMMGRLEVWWSDPTELFLKYRDSLEMHKHPLAKFQVLQQFYRQLENMFCHIGRVEVAPSTVHLAQIVKHIATVFSLSEENVLKDTLYLFSVIGQKLSKVNEMSAGVKTEVAMREEVNLPLVVDLLSGAAVFPTKMGQWVSLSDLPMVADSEELEKMFDTKPGVYFLQLEATDPIGQRNARRAGRTADPESIKDFIKLFPKIQFLSDCIQTEETTSGFQPCSRGQTYLHNVIGLVQRFLYFTYPEVYETVKTTKATTLKDLQFIQVDRLEMKYQLINHPEVFEIKPEKCVIKEKHFYFQTQYVGNQAEVNRELAKYIAEGNEDCMRELRSFLSQAASILEEKSEESMDSMLARQRVPIGTLPSEEEVWEVPLPIIPVVEKVHPEPSEQKEYMVYGRGLSVPGSEEAKAAEDKEDTGIKSWPPVKSMGGDVSQVQTPKGKAKESKWQPPEAPDYIKQSKELPSNIIFQKKNEEAEPTNKAMKEGPSRQNSEVKERGGVSRQVSQTSDGKPSPRSAVEGTKGRVVWRQVSQSGLEHKEEATEKGVEDDVSVEGGFTDSGETRKRKLRDGSNEEERTPLPKKLNVNIGEDGTKMETEDESGKSVTAKDSTEGDGKSDYIPLREPGSGDVNMGQSSVIMRPQDESGNVKNPTGRKPFLHFDIPLWTDQAQEVEYTELARGESLTLPPQQLTSQPSVLEIGRWGELLVFDYLRKQREERREDMTVVWVNEHRESGFPYDFEVKYKTADQGDQTVYIEVKATMSRDKYMFEISAREVEVALQKGCNYEIYRVFGAGSDKCKLMHVTNIASKMQDKAIKLFMLL